jgi:hypothetical protein
VRHHFDLDGFPLHTAASGSRRASARRDRRIHPDFGQKAYRESARSFLTWRGTPAFARDTAVDFVSVTEIADRIQDAFFTTPD